MEIIAWLILRLVYAWMFIYPLKTLLTNWPQTKKTVAIIIPYQTTIASIMMVLVMLLGGLAILFGFYARIAGFFLLIYNLMGFIVHYRLAEQASHLSLSEQASNNDKDILANSAELASIGHVTSAQKNIVLASVACFFMLMGSGPWSIIS